jgi:hypothetical protein
MPRYFPPCANIVEEGPMKKRDRASIPDFSKKPKGIGFGKLPEVARKQTPPPPSATQRSGKPQATSAKSGGQRGK